MTRPKDVGTSAETCVVNYFQDVVGFTDDECMRRVMHGGNDKGDIRLTGIPVMVEVKCTATFALTSWTKQVAAQTKNAGARWGVLIWSPPGLGKKSVENWVAIEWADTAIVPFSNRGMIFSGPLTKLASVVAQYGTVAPIYRHDVDGDLALRARPLHCWVQDLQELVATRTAR